MAVTPRQQVRGELVRLAHRGTGLREFALAAAGILARTVSFDGICLLTLDPATLLPTGEVVHDALPPEATARMTEIEFAGADVNAFAALIAAAYGLTSRERRITQLVARGLGTTAIADYLHLSPWTVQDHLKSIFDKTGTSSRGELIHHIFFQHYAPQLTE